MALEIQSSTYGTNPLCPPYLNYDGYYSTYSSAASVSLSPDSAWHQNQTLPPRTPLTLLHWGHPRARNLKVETLASPRLFA